MKNEMIERTPPIVFKQNKPIDWTIYGKNITPIELRDNFQRFHINWKYRFFKPLIGISKRLLKNTLVKKIDDEAYNKTLRVFDTAYETALRRWVELYTHPKDPDKVYLNNNFLRDVKELLFTIIINDTAYREFFNMLMFQTAIEVNKNFPECHHHLVYKAKEIMDVGYYMAFNELNKNSINIAQLPERYYIGEFIVINKQKYQLSQEKTRMCINGCYYKKYNEVTENGRQN